MNEPSPSSPSARPAAGSSLVEVMLAVFLMGLLVLAGGAFLSHARAAISHQRNRRAALEAAAGRMEAVRATHWSLLQPTNLTFSTHYLSRSNAAWVVSASDPGETVTINQRAVPLTTRIQYLDLDVLAAGSGIPDSGDLLSVRVDAGYRVGSADRVSLESFHGP